MRRLATLLVLLSAVACSNDGGDPQATSTPATQIAYAPGAIETATLRADDLGGGFEAEKDAAPSTIQVGGKVGPANVKGAEQEHTTAFKQKDDSGYVTNSIFLLESVDLARAVMLAHRQATEGKWTQERKDGGGATFRTAGELDLPALGEEVFTAAINSEVRPGDGEATKRKIEYVVYRIDRVIAFVIAQDVKVSTFARRQEQKVARLTG